MIMSPSPHIHSGDRIDKNMYGVLIALLPAFVVMLLQFGWDALRITLIATVASVLAEWLIVRFMLGRKSYILDGSALLTGVLLAFNLPSSLPWWLVVMGAVVAIGIGKMAFGGLGNNIFNPALVGRVFLLISYPAQMTTWSYSGGWIDALAVDASTSATPLGLMKAIIKGAPNASWDAMPSAWDLFLGLNNGSMGEISAIALLIGLAYLLIRRIISWHIPVSILGTVFIVGSLMHLIDPAIYPPATFHLLTGGVLLGSVFMATDYVTSPITARGQIVYGIAIGLLTVAIRLFGSYPEGMSFAILIMNAFTPLINTYFPTKHFGHAPKRKEVKA